jgi:hypothetical protein
MIRLEYLDVSNNSLSLIPSTIGSLTRISSLYANNNMIGEIPPQMCDMSNLYSVSLDKNILKCEEVCVDDYKNVLKKSCSDEEQNTCERVGTTREICDGEYGHVCYWVIRGGECIRRGKCIKWSEEDSKRCIECSDGWYLNDEMTSCEWCGGERCIVGRCDSESNEGCVECERDYTGKSCEIECNGGRGGCGSHGRCILNEERTGGVCLCEIGWNGEGCENKEESSSNEDSDETINTVVFVFEDGYEMKREDVELLKREIMELLEVTDERFVKVKMNEKGGVEVEFIGREELIVEFMKVMTEERVDGERYPILKRVVKVEDKNRMKSSSPLDSMSLCRSYMKRGMIDY